MMKKLLVANRGEIAVRLIRAAHDYGIKAVAVYSDADAEALHVSLADEAWGLGAGRASETYLDIGKLIEIAKKSGADAVHPGYGFLSERAEFAEAVLDAGLIWVGPSPEVVRRLGDKIEARRIATEVGAPLVRGSDGPLKDAAAAVEFAREVGLPIAIKAAFGGGGRGMKVARQLVDVAELFDSAVREATEAFGRGECYGEQFLDRPRHVEAQVIADTHGNVLVLGTRDCSLQRRNQKLVEEAPAPFLSDEQRARIHEAARAICAHAGYTSAGTVEFLLSESGALSFLEVNTRLQVEHPVTEMTTGVDIVIEQLRVADGLPLSITETPAPIGHAFEFRLNAEDAGRGFLPTPGRIDYLRAPSGPGIRFDSGVESGSVVPALYDSLFAKLIVHGRDRAEALARARRALAELEIKGIASVLPFHREVLNQPAFLGTDGFKVYTGWIEAEFPPLPPEPRPEPADQALIRTHIEIDGKRHALALPAALFTGTHAPAAAAPQTRATEDALEAPMPCLLQSWLVEEGAKVEAGEAIAIIEAMKAETRVLAEQSGVLHQLAPAGSSLGAGEIFGRISRD